MSGPLLTLPGNSDLDPGERLRVAVALCPEGGSLTIPQRQAQELLRHVNSAGAYPVFMVLELPPPDDRMQPAVLIYTASLAAYHVLGDLALALLRWLA